MKILLDEKNEKKRVKEEKSKNKVLKTKVKTVKRKVLQSDSETDEEVIDESQICDDDELDNILQTSEDLCVLCEEAVRHLRHISPTHFSSNNSTPTVIDLILTKNFLLENEPQSLSELNSDHNSVIFEISNLRKDNDNRQITSFKNTNWHNFRQDLDNEIQINHNISTTEQLEHEINQFTKSVQKIRKKHSTTRIVASLRKDKINTG
ncbi:hypothetical protein TcasGA2_TC010288 [Tribolium castaneum]|uniref:Endonuclease/exonuclease/phosphatase domain-containing protein n=1 Tax=Tribolium castaneum TaxID=7070 RepID=D7EJI6_TRICA|nr:hypothetical protein TcasGA2_TC010288 [Tribolium castaneum]